MKKHVLLVICAFSCAAPAWAQTKPSVRAAQHADPCTPIGRTADGKLIYSLKCNNMPAPPPPPVAAVEEAPQSSGLFTFRPPQRDDDGVVGPPMGSMKY